ncbi:MAG TPA: S8 family serine peptidase [Candidatus Saccharimonadaceae bacterium]|nr:S8 family serine peptidase [Candidatus Saccharimonadaceae bacterium]
MKPGQRILHLALLAALFSGPARSAPIPESVALKLDPRLTPALAAPDAPVSVWVSFADKGERSPAELALLLARAQLDLSPQARARRERAQVQPLVDYLDIPLYGPYVDALRARGLSPYGQSRWFNQVAVRVPGARLTELAGLSFVSHLAPVELAMRMRPAPDGEARATSPASLDCGTCMTRATSFNYGSMAAAMAQIGATAVHDSGFIGTGVLVCILDEGFNSHSTHEALRNVILGPGHERDFVQGDTLASDSTNLSDYNHGTEVMGCVAGNKPGTYLGSGFGATYALGRTEVHSSETPQEMVNWGMGAEWADSLGADVITSSLGYNQFDGGVGDYTFADMNGHTTIVTRAAEIAAAKGILVLNAAGNEGNNSWQKVIAPADANGDSVLAIGAVTSTGARASFSSLGPTADLRIKPDLCALGSNDPVVIPNSGPTAYGTASGTSFATPIMAGLAACLIQARPHFTPSMIIRALRETASQAGAPDTLKGYGIPNGLAALRWGFPGVGVGTPPPAPLGLALVGPNPLSVCDGATGIRFALGATAPPSAAARLDVFDSSGRRVRRLFSGVIQRGEFRTVSWDGRADDGHLVVSGVYFVGFDAGGHVSSARLVWLR